jgi:pentafunctional AROM polypeptide
VTIPHKENIIPLLDEVRGAAAQIGAVNTVVVETAKPAEASHRKRLVGYNTDWIGIRRPVARLLAGKKNQDGKMPGVGLVIGAGNVYSPPFL